MLIGRVKRASRESGYKAKTRSHECERVRRISAENGDSTAGVQKLWENQMAVGYFSEVLMVENFV